jgi:hypothetical protein
MEGLELVIEQPARPVEMRERGGAVAVPICHHRQHGLAGWITRTQFQETVEQRYGLPAVRFELDLSGSRQRRHAVR